jgi:Putative peptidoglycan binding domain
LVVEPFRAPGPVDRLPAYRQPGRLAAKSGWKPDFQSAVNCISRKRGCKILRSLDRGGTNGKRLFNMKTIVSCIITGLLMTQLVQAGDRGGGVGFGLPTPSATRAAPPARTPAAQVNHVRIPAQGRVNIQGGNSRQTNDTAFQSARISQDQRQANHANFAAARRRGVHEMHDHNWWRQHFRVIVFVIGGFYYWDDGYWYPAWGYDASYNNYDYDGPIYAYGDLMPDQVVTNVQSALREEGYYSGPINGSLNSATQAALANYQRDHGLEVTAAIDEPTIESLGLE